MVTRWRECVTSADATKNVFPIKKDGMVFYVSLDGRHLRYFSYDLLSESFKDGDANILSYDITRCKLKKIKYKRDKNDLIFAICGEKLLSANINLSEKIIGWHERTTEGNFKDIAVMTNNEGEAKLFALVKRGSDYFIEMQSDYVEFTKRDEFSSGDKQKDDIAHIRKNSEELKRAVNLDNARLFSGLQKGNTITFDGTDTITASTPVFSSSDINKLIMYKTSTGYESGIFKIKGYTSTTQVTVEVLQTPTANTYSNWYLTFNQITGLSDFNGKEVAVVGDGGFLNTFTVSGGTIDLGKEVGNAIVGYLYKGIIETFNLGFPAGSDNTQTTKKIVNRVSLRFLNSAGGKVGTSLYSLQSVQKRTEADLNYLPTVLMNGTKEVLVGDTYKNYYY